MLKIEEILNSNLANLNLLDKKLLIGFSGGGDSTALILAMHELKKINSKLNFEAFHVNYGLRKESNKDQKFVEDLCKKLKIKLTVKNFLNEEINFNNKSEDNLRNIRYKLMSSYISKSKLFCVVTAHNLNDHVETFIMKLSRGIGMKGMEGIKEYSIINEFNKLKIYRPLIKIKKNDLFDYCISKNIQPMKDISNLDIKFSRNRIRNNVIPELEKLNPDFLNTVNRLTELVKEFNIYQNKSIDKKFDKIKIVENNEKISFNRNKFNELDNLEKKLILKSKCESFSPSIFIESKHLDIILSQCLSQKINFSLDMPGPIAVRATSTEISLIKLISK